MTEKRKNPRFDIKQEIYLYHGVSKYEGRLDNISCSGALVEVDTLPRTIQPGDVCYLAFAVQPDAILCACRVVRLLSSHVGLTFSETAGRA